MNQILIFINVKVSLIIIAARVKLANSKSGISGIVKMYQSSKDGALKIKGYIKGLPAGKIM